MPAITASFAVEYRFQVHFARDVFAPDHDLLAEILRPAGDQPARALVYVDESVVAARPDLPRCIHAWFGLHEPRGVRLAAAPETVPGGEAGKRDLGLVERVARRAAEVGLCRHGYVIIIGGGAVLDAVGLAASLIHRGLRQVRLPTTTLAQADAGLGVKNAVNACGQKNFLGTFTPPWAIINDARFLDHLDDRSWRDGISEAFKVAIIKDAGFLRELLAAAPLLAVRDAAAMGRLIERSAHLHLDHIAQGGDPFERGSSRPLDFGHWSAHRLEMLSHHRLRHGEAVAIGVALDLLYAAALGRIAQAEAEEVLAGLATCGFRLWDEVLDLRDAEGRRQVLAGLAQFREHLGGELTLAMPDGLGRRSDLTSFDEALFERCASALRRWAARRARPAPATSR
jgi:3-dehydroquinate synthase